MYRPNIGENQSSGRMPQQNRNQQPQQQQQQAPAPTQQFQTQQMQPVQRAEPVYQSAFNQKPAYNTSVPLMKQGQMAQWYQDQMNNNYQHMGPRVPVDSGFFHPMWDAQRGVGDVTNVISSMQPYVGPYQQWQERWQPQAVANQALAGRGDVTDIMRAQQPFVQQPAAAPVSSSYYGGMTPQEALRLLGG